MTDEPGQHEPKQGKPLPGGSRSSITGNGYTPAWIMVLLSNLILRWPIKRSTIKQHSRTPRDANHMSTTCGEPQSGLTKTIEAPPPCHHGKPPEQEGNRPVGIGLAGVMSGVPTPSGSAHQGWPEPPVEKTTPPVCCQPPTAVLQTQNSYSLVHLTPQRSATIHDSDEPTNRSGSTYTHFHINPCESLFKKYIRCKIAPSLLDA